MPRRTKHELLAEFHRLSDVFETMWEILCEIEPERAEFRHLITSRVEMLNAVEMKRATMSEVIAGVTQAINDYAVVFDMCSPTELETYELFLANYHKRTSRHFFDDIGRPSSKAKVILRRGSIRDETEYFILNEYLIDTGQSVLSNDQIANASQLIKEFQSRQC